MTAEKAAVFIFVGDDSMNTLMDFRYKRMFKAEPGQAGAKRNRFGKDGEDIIIKVLKEQFCVRRPQTR